MYTESNGLGSNPKPVYHTSLKRMAELDAEIEADWQRYWAEQAALRVKHVARPMVRAPPAKSPVVMQGHPTISMPAKLPRPKPKPQQPLTIADQIAAVDVPELVIELAELQQ